MKSVRSFLLTAAACLVAASAIASGAPAGPSIVTVDGNPVSLDTMPTSRQLPDGTCINRAGGTKQCPSQAEIDAQKALAR